MLTAAARNRFTIVLVGARNPQNIGAAARAMQDFGFSDLRVVNEFTPPFEAAQLEAKSAVGAQNVMANARQFNTLADAIADCTLIAGTTAIGGRELTTEIITLQTAAPQLINTLGNGESRVALLFGSEKTGLTNEQLSHCQLLLTIPLFEPEAARHLSMNLGQAVAVCLYELSREGFEHSRALPEIHKSPATSEDRERLTQQLLSTMEQTGYARRFPANAREHVVRRLAQQLGITRDEAATWLGFLRHLQR
jgi:TrmH family RNA methyltransferase